MPFWSGDTLEKRLPSLITTFDKNQIDGAAYTLRMGKEAYITPDYQVPVLSKHTKLNLNPGQHFLIPPGQFAFLLTEEIIKMPDHAIGFISLKATIKFKGLINVSGFHVDPGYEGHLIYSVFNAGPSAIHLERGQSLFLIWYADLGNASEENNASTKYARRKEGHKSISSALINNISGEILSLQDLSKAITALNNKVTQFIYIGVALLSLFVAILAPVLSDRIIEILNRPSPAESTEIQIDAPAVSEIETTKTPPEDNKATATEPPSVGRDGIEN